MNSLVYHLSYLFGSTPWDSRQVPPELLQAFQEGSIPAGPVLDLGCGTGTCVIYMADQGRKAYGVDFVPRAIKTALRRARDAGLSDRTAFFAADVARLADISLPKCAFALDMGCFHGIRPSDRRKYAQALADILIPGGKYMLYAMEPCNEMGPAFGMEPDEVEEVFTSFFAMDKVEHGDFRGRGSNWFWMTRKE